ncbi:MAG: CRTAC1 family protein [Deltaproteobacteria bacterium]|nr:CRTAC1 family protein [Deltaproteobacteria bacterium]
MYVNNYRLQTNLFFENNGDGTFTEKAGPLGLAGTRHGSYYGHSIGVAWGDLNNDGRFDVVVGNLAHPRFYGISDKTEVLLHGLTDTYHDLSGDWSRPASAAGLRYQETHSVPALADFDQDGNLDLVITAVYDGRPTDFYWGNGDGTFRLDAYHAGITTTNGWGVAVADIDHDGDLDLFATTLFVNDLPAARKGHWLQVRAVGNVAANRAALGATVRVTAGGVTRLRHVEGGTGQGCQDSLYLHFGLGSATSVEAVNVVFPGGKLVSYAGPFTVDQRLWVFEDGSTHLGWAP